MAVKQIIHGFILFEDFFGHPLFQLLSGCLEERLEPNSDKVIYFVSDKHFKIKTQDKCHNFQGTHYEYRNADAPILGAARNEDVNLSPFVHP